MNSFLRLILLAALFCGRLSVYGMVPLLRNLPSEATTSTAKVKPEVMVNRLTFTTPKDIPIGAAMNEMGIHISSEVGPKPRVRHSQEDLHSPSKRIKIEPTEESQDPDLSMSSRVRQRGEDSHLPAKGKKIEPTKEIQALGRNEETITTPDLTTSVRSPRVVPYSFFFQSTGRMPTITNVDPYIMKLARCIQTLISKLGVSYQPWGSWIHENQPLVLECFSTAHAALHKDLLGECERTWALGIVAALVKHLSSTSTEVVKRLQNAPWKHHVYLEIHAAIEYEESLTERFRLLLLTSQSHVTNQGLEECFSRARLIKSHDEIRARYFPAKRGSIDRFVSDNLLNVKIPEEEISIKLTIRRFAHCFKNVEIPSWEGTYGKAIFIYLMTHWQNSYPGGFNALLKWIEMDFNLYRDLHLPFFKYDAKSLLRTSEISSNWIKYDELVDPSRPLRAPILERFLSFGGDEEIPLNLTGSLYKLAVIASLIHPSLRDLVVQGIDQNPDIVQRLAPVWLDMYHALEVGIHQFFGYHHIPFKRRPNYFAMAHRNLLSEQLLKFHATESLGILFHQTSLHMFELSPGMVTGIILDVEHILLNHVENDELPKVYLMVLQVIHHLIKYSPGASHILLKQLDKDIGFRESLSLSIANVLESSIFVDHVASVDECVLAYECEDVLLSLQNKMSPATIWQWGEVSKQEEHIDQFAKNLEEELSPYSTCEIGDLPDPKEESLLWLQR